MYSLSYIAKEYDITLCTLHLKFHGKSRRKAHHKGLKQYNSPRVKRNQTQYLFSHPSAKMGASIDDDEKT